MPVFLLAGITALQAFKAVSLGVTTGVAAYKTATTLATKEKSTKEKS